MGIYKVVTLSPMHIGSGRVLTNWDIGVDENNYVFVFNLDKIFDILSEKDIDELAKLFEGINSQQVKNLGEFLNRKGIRDWEAVKKYKLKMKDAKKANIGEIEEFVKEGYKAFIPGSTLKGFIRTAVIYSFLKEKDFKFEVAEDKGRVSLRMREPIDGKTIEGISKINKWIEENVCGSGATVDVFKTLIVSDSEGIPIEHCGEIKQIIVANTTSLINPTVCECVQSDTCFSGIHIKVKDIKLEEPRIKLSRLQRELYEEFIKDDKWLDCLRIFSSDLIKAERRFWEDNKVNIMRNMEKTYSKNLNFVFRHFNFNDVLNHFERLFRESQQSTIIRLGKFSGYLTHSIGLLLAMNHEPYNLGKLGKLIFPKSAHEDLFPLTRRLTLDNQTLGWCKLEAEF